MSRHRRWLQKYLDLFVMEVRHPDGSRFIVAIDSTGFGECWLPIDIIEPPDGEIPVSV